jgi:N-acetyltransferase 10
VSQALALFVKSIRKIGKQLEGLQKAAVSVELPDASSTIRHTLDSTAAVTAERSWKPLAEDLDEELAVAGGEEAKRLRERQREIINALDLSK